MGLVGDLLAVTGDEGGAGGVLVLDSTTRMFPAVAGAQHPLMGPLLAVAGAQHPLMAPLLAVAGAPTAPTAAAPRLVRARPSRTCRDAVGIGAGGAVLEASLWAGHRDSA